MVKITKEFLEAVLSVPIDQFWIKSGSESGDNLIGEMISVKVKTVQGKELNLIHKCFPSEDNGAYQYTVSNQIYRTETEFYTNFLPKLERGVQTRKELVGGPGPKFKFPTPTLYASFNNDKDDYLTMEDLRPQGFAMGNKFTGFKYEEVSLILREISKLHAFSYFLIKQQGEQLFSQELSRFRNNVWQKEEMKDFYEVMLKYSYTNAVKLIRDESSRRKFEGKIEAFHDTLMEIPRKTKSLFPVLVHGDLWTNNILIKYSEGDGKPVAVKFIDFQLSRRGNIYEDLTYFLFTSTSPEFRKEFLKQVLTEYFESFEASLQEIEFPMPEGFTLTQFLSGFFDCLVPSFVYMTFAIPLQLGNHKLLTKMDLKELVQDEDEDMGREIAPEGPVRDMILRSWFLLKGSEAAMQRLQEISYEFGPYFEILKM